MRSRPVATTALDLVGGDRSVVVARINGELRDLATEVTDTDIVEPVTVDSPEGLAVLRHSTAHVLAQAPETITSTRPRYFWSRPGCRVWLASARGSPP